MGIDTSIYSNLLRQPKSVQDYDNERMHAQQNQLALSLGQQKADEYTRSVNDANRLRGVVSGFTDDPVANQQALLRSGHLTEANAYAKSNADLAKTNADVGETKAKTGKLDLESIGIASQQHKDALGPVNDPQSAAAWVTAAYKDPRLAAISAQGGTLEQTIARIPTDPQQFQQWKLQSSLGADKLIEYTRPNANTVANNQTSVATNAATNATSRANNAATQAGENARSAASQKNAMMIAGMSPDGSPSASVESMAQQIAAGKLAPINGFALARPQGQAVMARVAAINPDYDATTYGAKVKAAKDFGSGPQGNAMRSFAVAGQHLDQLGTLVDALDNGNMQIVNKIGNAYAQQTGSAAPTNFDAAKDVVSKEVIKAIVGGGGGVSEREELARMMSNVKSPAQLKGVISQYRSLMGAQHDALLQQRRAAGLPDSSMPSYTGGASAAATNSQGWALHTDSNGNKAYVSPDGKQFQEVK